MISPAENWYSAS